jgi:hypothetical protein
VGLSAIRAAAAGHALVEDDLAIKVVFGLDNAAKEHPAVHAGTGAQALKPAELRLYSLVVILGWVRIVRYSHGVNLPVRLAGSRGVASPAGPFPFQQPHGNTSTTVIQWFYSVFSKVFQQQSRGKEVTMVTRIMEIDGAKLRRLRTRRLWLIGDLAEKSGVHRNLISDYELGKSGAHPDTIRKLADALDVEPVELLKD